MNEFSKYVGLDTHKETIAVAVADALGGKARYYGEITNTPEAVGKLMWSNVLRASGLLTFLACSSSIYADTTLFQPVEASLRSQAESLNNEFLVRETYFARNHRLITVDASALDRDDSVTLTLFNGEKISPEFRSRHENVGYIQWVGGLPDVEKEILKSNVQFSSNPDPRDQETLAVVARQMSEVRINVTTYDVKTVDGETTYTPIWERTPGLATGRPVTTEKGGRPTTTRSVSASFADLKTGKRYSISPLPDSPSVHLLAELDPDKEFAVIDDEALQELSADRKAEMQSKAQDYQTYLAENDIGS